MQGAATGSRSAGTHGIELNGTKIGGDLLPSATESPKWQEREIKNARHDGIAHVRGSGATIVKGEFSDLFFSQTMQSRPTAGPADLAKASVFPYFSIAMILIITSWTTSTGHCGCNNF
jgi:hypothetical protein